MAATKLFEGNRVIDIATEYGFDTHNGFSKAFKKEYGFSTRMDCKIETVNFFL